MNRFLPLLLILAAPVVAADPPKATPPGKGTQYAFLVAAAEYDKNELKPLPYSQKETDEFRQVLLKTGFDDKNVKFLHDKAERRFLPERKKIAHELDLLLGRAAADDTVLVLLNGHGVHFAGDATGYFCPVDAKLTDKSSLLPMDGKGGVFEQLKACKAKRKVLLVNACRNDPASDRSLAGGKIVLDDDDKDEVPEGIAALYSCKPGERSYYYDPTDAKSKGRERSLYMHHLIEAWGKGGKTTIEDVFKAVRTNAAADADVLFGRKQNPVIRREYRGDGEWLVAAAGTSDEKTEEFEWKGEKRKRTVLTLDLGGEQVEFVQVPKGSFQMGSSGADKEAYEFEKPQHKVTFTRDLWVAKYPVTKGQFAAFVKATNYKTEAETDGMGGYGYDGKEISQADSFSWRSTGWDQTDRHPVVNVTWNDAQKYCEWATKQGKQKLRLLTEAEYEYANRGGTDTFYFSGDDVASLEGYANVSDKSAKAKFDYFKAAPFDDENVYTSPVGKFKPNGFGLYDTSGNVSSWCVDWYDATSYRGREGGVIDPKVITDGEQKNRVIRGGTWGVNPNRSRGAIRRFNTPTHRIFDLGFRVCAVPD